MALDQTAIYIGAIYVGISLCLGLIADIYIFSNFAAIRHQFFSRSKPHVPWRLYDVGLIVIFYVLIQLIFVLALFILGHFAFITEQMEHYISLFWATVGVNIFLLLFIFGLLQHKYSINWDQLGFHKNKQLNYLGLGLLAYVAFLPFFFALILVSAIVCSFMGIEPKPHVLIDIFREEKSLWVIGGLVVFASVIGPIIEELVFRGVLYPALRKKVGVQNAILGTSLFFAVIHFNWFQFIPVFGLGVLLAYLYEKTNSLLPSIMLHAMNNAVSTAVALALLKATT